MELKAGYCRLILDGIAHGGFSYALELLDDPGRRRFGFLSGPIRHLKAAETAKRAQIDFGHGEFAQTRVLQVSNDGIALIAVELVGVPDNLTGPLRRGVDLIGSPRDVQFRRMSGRPVRADEFAIIVALYG